MEKRTEIIMGLPVSIEISTAHEHLFDAVFGWFRQVDSRFSTYKKNSEISRLNRLEIEHKMCSKVLTDVLKSCDNYKKITNGYFDVDHNNYIDPSGYVKGWAIEKACEMLDMNGVSDFCIEAGGDIFCRGLKINTPWKVGIRTPKSASLFAKVLSLSDMAIATSGLYERGNHIYNPLGMLPDIVSVSVVGPSIERADVFATAVFAMGLEKGITFIELQDFYEAYIMIDENTAVSSSGFSAL